MDKIFETKRLYCRPLTPDDIDNIRGQLQDDKVMYAYEGAFSDEMVKSWLANQLKRYEDYGFGLFAVIRKEDGAFIGQAGITMQDLHGLFVHEVGYLINYDLWHLGYATEIAKAATQYAFDKLHANKVYAIIRDTNKPSQAVASRLGMQEVDRLTKHYRGFTMPHIAYCVDKKGFKTLCD